MRCFVAVDLAPGVRAVLARTQEALRRAAPRADVRWTRPEGLHVTLKFLGEVPEARCAEVAAALSGVAAAHRAVGVLARGLGGFPGAARPRPARLRGGNAALPGARDARTGALAARARSPRGGARAARRGGDRGVDRLGAGALPEPPEPGRRTVRGARSAPARRRRPLTRCMNLCSTPCWRVRRGRGKVRAIHDRGSRVHGGEGVTWAST